jgi:hypothetical protein
MGGFLLELEPVVIDRNRKLDSLEMIKHTLGGRHSLAGRNPGRARSVPHSKARPEVILGRKPLSNPHTQAPDLLRLHSVESACESDLEDVSFHASQLLPYKTYLSSFNAYDLLIWRNVVTSSRVTVRVGRHLLGFGCRISDWSGRKSGHSPGLRGRCGPTEQRSNPAYFNSLPCGSGVE